MSPATAVGAVIESEDQRAGKIRSVEGAGGVAEMMIEAEKRRPERSWRRWASAASLHGIFATLFFCAPLRPARAMVSISESFRPARESTLMRARAAEAPAGRWRG